MEYPVSASRQLAEALKAARKSLGLTQAQVAGRVGLLPKTVSALESDPEASSISSLYKLLAALNLEPVLRPRKPAEGRRAPRGEW
jgi:HTH-type transcriptional regulator / antitoxin HipB